MGAISDVTSEFKHAGSKEKKIIIIAVVGITGVALYLYTRRQASAGGQGILNARSGTETPQPSGYPETSKQVPTIPGGVAPLYDPAGNLIAFQNPITPPQPISTSGGKSLIASIRDRFSQVGVHSYDAAHSQGVPIRSGASGSSSIIGYSPFGSSIKLEGGPMAGGTNIPNPTKSSGGSTIWYKLANGGYVSQYDVTGVPSA